MEQSLVEEVLLLLHLLLVTVSESATLETLVLLTHQLSTTERSLLKALTEPLLVSEQSTVLDSKEHSTTLEISAVYKTDCTLEKPITLVALSTTAERSLQTAER